MHGRSAQLLGIALIVAACGDGAPPAGQKPSATQASTGASPAAAPTPAPTASTAAPASSAAAPTRIAAQHVLIGYKGTKVGTATRTKEEARKLAEEVREKAVKGEDFAKLAEKYSDDPASKERFGSVGTFDRDGMVKPFSDAAFALKVNEVSQVVETYFGFHVIKRNQ
jgi:peptidyl-prolyl cis-trans isomerase NIMA-interacting 1